MKDAPTKLPVQYRSLALDRAALDSEKRTIALSFSSETPVDRWFGQEILSHEKGAMRMDRLKNGAALLLNHRSDSYIGVVESASVDSKDKMGRAEVRFGNSPLADQVLTDVRDGILRNVSVGYIVHRFELASSDKKTGEVYRATDWEPVEISLVPVPADPNVGVGRSAEAGAKEFPVQFDQPVEATREIETAAAVISQEGKPVMKTVEEVREISKAEGLRVQEINDLASKYSSVLPREKVAEFVSKDTPVADVRKFIMDAQIADAQKNAVRNVNVADLTDEEKQNYSFVRAINQAGEEEKPGFETEVSKAIGKALGRESSRHSIFVPVNVPMLLSKREAEMQKRAGLATTSGSVGGNVVFTSMDSFIDFLYNRMKVMSLGATKLSGLRDTVAFPGQATLGTATWVAENPGSDVSDSDSSFNQITMSPKMLQASTSYSRKLLSQASIDVEAFVRNDLAQRNALAIDLAAINGLGSSNQPKGILNQSGIGSVVTGGAPLVNDNFVDLETAVAVANADVQNMATLTTPEVRGKLRKAPKLQNTLALPIWSDGGQVNGYRAEVSNQVPKTLSGGAGHGVVFGDWSQLLIGDWAAFEIIVDPFRLKKQGMIEVTTYNQMDCNVRYAASFAAIIDANPNA